MAGSMQAFRITAAQKRYLEQQLDKVSRSFAILIPYIESPLRHYLGVAYLLCRVADNVEDCGQPQAWKKERLDEFMLLLQQPQLAAAQLGEWDKRVWPGLTSDERQMMGVKLGLPLWQIYAAIPDDARGVVRQWIGVMATGMSKLTEPDMRPFFVKRKGVDILETEADYDEYCYYVAGTVGSLASELVVQQYELPAETAAVLQARASSCGRSLQKTNIVKDFVEDLNRGVCYLPDSWMGTADHAPLELKGADQQLKALVIDNVLSELRASVDYVLALPQHAGGYRRASLLCLFPSYHTMLAAAQRQDTLFTAEHQIKISRTTMMQCIGDSDKVLRSDDAIRQYCARMEDRIYDAIGRPVAV